MINESSLLNFQEPTLMSNQQSNKAKFIASILAITSLAALPPVANAQTVKPSNATRKILNRANLNTNSNQRQFTNKKPSRTLERLNKPVANTKKRGANGICFNRGCRKRRVRTNLKIRK